MQQSNLIFLAGAAALLLLVASILAAIALARRIVGRAEAEAAALLDNSAREADSRQKELLVAAQERALAADEEADRRERELEEREASIDARLQELQRKASEIGQERRRTADADAEAQRRLEAAREAEREAQAGLARARADLERIAGLTAEQARSELVRGIEEDARREGALIARKIEEEAREGALRAAANLIVQATQRVNLRDAMESTVSFIELPNDEMKGRIIGKEGRNIRALEMATGVDLIVDDTPRSIWVSCFDPVRREIARIAVGQLLEDGRIHPARIEEVVQKVADNIDERITEKGEEAVFSLGITDMNPRLVRMIGQMRYHMTHGQNLLQHCLETALIAGYMVEELGGGTMIARRAGLLHEIGHVAEDGTEHPLLWAAELAGKYGEQDAVCHAIRSLHGEVQPTTLEALMLNTANRLSETRPGARKENLAVFIERLRRLEAIAERFDEVRKAYAVKAGKDLRVLVDVTRTSDEDAYQLSRKIARAVERELSYPGQIKISVVRETRAVRFAV